MIRRLPENTGISVQLRQWYDMQKGKEFRTITFMYGVAKGQSDLIHRIKLL